MKRICLRLGTLVFSFSCIAGVFAQEGEKQYIPLGKVFVSEHGIFIETDQGVGPVESIAYDYSTQSFYLSARNEGRVVLVSCPNCNQRAYNPLVDFCHNCGWSTGTGDRSSK
jgi:hypothetical protein